jgi:probable F420-dependent oxidoreductase
MFTVMELQGHLRRLGVWHFTDSMSLVQAEEFAGRIEQLGYSALWLPDTVGRDPFAHIAHLARGTESLVFATGIASIFHRHPGAMKQAANTLAEQTDGRFVLGLGVSHGPMVAGLRRLDYSKPLSQMRDYLAAMDASPYGATPPEISPTRLLAALGPKMTELARDAADGAHPYWTTPEHTAQTRQILGPDKLLCVEQKVVLSTDPSVARELASQAVGAYSDLPNYRNNWKRLGFSDDEIDRREPRFIDAVVAWGNADAIGVRLMAHYDAGATHVCIQPLSPDGFGRVDWSCLEALAPTG